MADHELEPLDPELRALLDASTASEPMPGAVRARLARRLDLSVALAAPVHSPDLGGPSGAGVAKGAGAAALAKKAWLLAAGAFVVGAGAGAGVTATMMERAPVAAPRTVQPEAREEHAARGPAMPKPAEPPLPVPADASPAESPPQPSVRKRPVSDVSPAARDALLSEERSLVEMARSALVRGDGAAALKAVQEHARRFPEGRLREERDSLWIQAQLRTGQLTEARERARKFRARYPGSLLLPLVESALSSIPVTESSSAPQSPRGTPPKDVHDEPATDRSLKQ